MTPKMPKVESTAVPPPANPPTYASTSVAPPTLFNPAAFGGSTGATILTSPFGAVDAGTTKRKTLFGQ